MGCELCKDGIAGGVEHVIDFFEELVVVVWIGHVAVFAGVEEVHNHGYFAALHVGLGQAEEVFVVAAVHSEDEVEVVEIVFAHLAGALAGDVKTVIAAGADGAAVGAFAGVPGSGACGIYVPMEVVGLGFCLHNTFCQGRATNISEANHQNFHSVNGFIF